MIDRVLGAVGQRVLNIFNREMKIAPAVDSRNGPGDTLQFGYFAIDPLRVEREPCVSVRCGYDIGGTGFSGDFQHGDGILERLRAIIESGQNMAMDIDHVSCYSFSLGRKIRETCPFGCWVL